MYLQYESLLNALPSVTFFVQFLAVGRSLVQLSAPCAAETVAPWLMASGDDSWSSVTTKGLPRMPAGMHFPCTVCYALPRVQRAGQRKVTPPNKDEAERPATVTHTSDNDGAQSERQALQHEIAGDARTGAAETQETSQGGNTGWSGTRHAAGL